MFCLVAVAVPAQSETTSNALWEQIVDAMRFNRLAEAAPLLEAYLPADPTNIEARRYLAVAYEQTGRVDAAQTVLQEGIAIDTVPPTGRAQLVFDLASLRGRGGDVQAAIAGYGDALRLDPGLAAAYLNRANAGVSTGLYSVAVDDYRRYLALRPTSSQRPEIERMIALLTETIAAEAERIREEEERRLAQEEAERIAAEEAQRAEEAARLAAEDRRRALLNSVLESLSDAGDEAESFEIENEDIETYVEDLDIVD